MGILEHAPRGHLDVVELDPEILAVAHDFFGVPRGDDRLRTFVADGLEFFCPIEHASAYDLVIVDVADPEAPQAGSESGFEADFCLELPPPEFVEREFLLDKALASVKDNGWLVVNVIAGRACLLKILDDLENWCARVYVLATDPNYLFYVSRDSALTAIPPSVVAAGARQLGLDKSCGAVFAQVEHSVQNLAKNVALGWLRAAAFRELLMDPSVMI
mmetsp:Transcript_19291/g.48774  ORF Transcript_19291/g.48774 Transcript_19291/m.48774 type:complete len:217 (-) Transcript_19291:42-692(-)